MLNTGLINKARYGMYLACGIWCVADASSVSPSSEQTEGLVCKILFDFASYELYSVVHVSKR